MSIGAEQQLINEQYIQLLNRVGYTTGYLHSCDANAMTAIGQASLTITIPKGQAVRIVSLIGNITGSGDGSGNGFLTLESFNLVGRMPSNAVFLGKGTRGTNLIGVNGCYIEYSSQELLQWSDYAEVGGLAPDLTLTMLADVNNSDASAHDVAVGMTALIEYYLLKASGHVGFP